MKRILILVVLALGATACGSASTDGPSAGGGGGSAGSEASGGSAGSGVSGGSAGGSANSGGAAQAGSGAGSMAIAGSAGMNGQCGGGCIELCEGGVCTCSCAASCEDFGVPTLDKSCATNDDCFAGVHTLDCCGSQVVLGYNVSAQSSFTDYEAECTERAICRCPPNPPTIEGGQVTTDLELRRAVCSAGQCVGIGPVEVGAL